MRTIVQGLLQRMGLYGLYSLWRKGPLREDGWFLSFDRQRPLDAGGEPLPYITYPAIEFLRRRARPEWSVFEYGSGASTLWWAKRVARVHAVEHDPAWHARVRGLAPPHVRIDLVPLDDRERERHSVVVIDGRQRVRCARHAVEALQPDGVILWDNAEREYYKPGFDYLAERGFRRVEFVGLPPGANEKCETWVFYRDGNCLGL